MVDVRAHGRLADVQSLGDLLVGAAFTQQGQYFFLARCEQSGQLVFCRNRFRPADAGKQLERDLWRQDRFARRQAADGL